MVVPKRGTFGGVPTIRTIVDWGGALLFQPVRETTWGIAWGEQPECQAYMATQDDPGRSGLCQCQGQ